MTSRPGGTGLPSAEPAGYSEVHVGDAHGRSTAFRPLGPSDASRSPYNGQNQSTSPVRDPWAYGMPTEPFGSAAVWLL
jgi:hypothetical protein